MVGALGGSVLSPSNLVGLEGCAAQTHLQEADSAARVPPVGCYSCIAAACSAAAGSGYRYPTGQSCRQPCYAAASKLTLCIL